MKSSFWAEPWITTYPGRLININYIESCVPASMQLITSKLPLMKQLQEQFILFWAHSRYGLVVWGGTSSGQIQRVLKK